MTQILGGPEHATCERSIEIAQRRQAGHGLVPEPGDRLQPGGHLRQLRHLIARQAEGGFALQEGPAGEALVQLLERVAHGRPHPVLLVGVVGPGNRLALPPGRRQAGKVIAAGAIGGVGKPRVVAGQLNGDLAIGLGSDR